MLRIDRATLSFCLLYQLLELTFFSVELEDVPQPGKLPNRALAEKVPCIRSQLQMSNAQFGRNLFNPRKQFKAIRGTKEIFELSIDICSQISLRIWRCSANRWRRQHAWHGNTDQARRIGVGQWISSHVGVSINPPK